MSTHRHIRRGVALRAILLCVTLVISGPGVVPSVSAHRALATFGYAPQAVGASPATDVTVTTTADTSDGADTSSFVNLNLNPGSDGHISLREALLAANSTIVTSALTISFGIPITDSGHYSGTWMINLTQPLPDLARGGVLVDGSTQKPGAQHPAVILNSTLGVDDGIRIVSSNNMLRKLTLMNFFGHGLIISGAAAGHNQIVGCYFGTDPTGTAARPNGTNIKISDGAHDNMIGGSDAASRNLISGSDWNSGVVISGALTHHNTVAGNWIGVDASGDVALSNAFAGVLLTDGTHDNVIGGSGQGNLIADNTHAIYINNSSNNTVTGNVIGLAAGGKKRLLNLVGTIFVPDFGIVVTGGAYKNTIGIAGQGNVISGNGTGISLFGGIDNIVAANIIGLDADGQIQFGNTIGLAVHAGAHDNQIGGPDAAWRNIISGNTLHGVSISDETTINNRLEGNFIGTDKTGLQGRSDGQYGVWINNKAHGNIIGGTDPGTGNVIVYNGYGGVQINSSENQMAGNYIGVGMDGTRALGNGKNGVRILGENNEIGPDNVIAHSFFSGIILNGASNHVFNNTLKSNANSGICVAGPGTRITGNTIVENGYDYHVSTECDLRGGIVITGTNNTVVTDTDILDNANFGIVVHGGLGNRILTNSISGNQAGGIRLEQGGNLEIDPPVIENVSASSIDGTTDDDTIDRCPFCLIEVFANSGNEGKYLVDSTFADANGDFTVTIPPGSIGEPYITATLTDGSGNTSPFAAAVDAPPPAPPPLYQYLPIMLQ